MYVHVQSMPFNIRFLNIPVVSLNEFPTVSPLFSHNVFIILTSDNAHPKVDRPSRSSLIALFLPRNSPSIFLSRLLDTMDSSPLEARWHENCSAKIRYNHCRQAPSETDSSRMSGASTAGNPSGGYLFPPFFPPPLRFRFEDTLSYHPGRGLRVTSFSRAHSSREVLTLIPGNIAYVAECSARSHVGD